MLPASTNSMNAANEAISLLRTPPQSVEAERAVLGSILIDNDAISKVMEGLVATDFYREAHKKIFEAMLALSEKNEPTDFLTVSHYLQSKGDLEAVGGAAALSSLSEAIPSSANVASYAKIVREKSILRKLIDTSTQIVGLGFEGQKQPEELLDQAERMIFEISENRSRPTFASVKEVVKESFKRIEKLYEDKKEITGLATGFKDLDAMTCGLQPNDLIILAARPSMGKTSFAINIAEHAAIHEKAPVAVFSLEMSKESLVTRMLCSQAMIDSSRLRKGELSDRDWPMLTKAAGHLSEAAIFIDDAGAPTCLEMRAKARRLKREHGLGLIIVDYLQLVRGSSSQMNREQEISEISRGLKALAKELSVPVIALSQLNRAVESRTNKRPQLSDLRESGAIEQDADIIAFIYRDEVYDPNTPEKGVAEIIIGKQRNGPTGTVKLAFLNSYTKFENLAYDNNQSEYAGFSPDEGF